MIRIERQIPEGTLTICLNEVPISINVSLVCHSGTTWKSSKLTRAAIHNWVIWDALGAKITSSDIILAMIKQSVMAPPKLLISRDGRVYMLNLSHRSNNISMVALVSMQKNEVYTHLAAIKEESESST